MVTCMSAAEQLHNQDLYTPGQLRFLLHLWPYLGYSRPPKDPNMQVSVSKVLKEGGWEKATAKAADIEMAVRWLNERDWRAAYTVRASYIVGLSLRDISGYLKRQGEPASHETVNRWRKDGLELMVAFLNGGLA